MKNKESEEPTTASTYLLVAGAVTITAFAAHYAHQYIVSQLSGNEGLITGISLFAFILCAATGGFAVAKLADTLFSKPADQPSKKGPWGSA